MTEQTKPAKKKEKGGMTEFETGLIGSLISGLEGSVYFEVGCRNGASFAIFGRSMPPGSLLLGVDMPGGPWGMVGSETHLEKVADTLRLDYRVELLYRDSQKPETLAEVKTVLDGQPVDALLLDADHSRAGVVSDLEMYSPLVRPGGIVIFHDCGFLGSPLCLEKEYKLEQVEHINTIHHIFASFCYRRKYVLVQDFVGMGAVWM